jgi:STE24 endopeptidase
MDGSKRSAKSNAFFTGFGRHRRIVLFDTLIANHAVEELVAVLAHEMGHYKMRHILKMMAAGILQTGILLFLMSLTINTPALFEAFYVNQPSVHAGLVFFGLLYAPLDFFLGLIVQRISRIHEYAADRFAAETTENAGAMIEALKKLSVHNLSNLSPHPFYVFLNYSHPPVMQRIEALQKV